MPRGPDIFPMSGPQPHLPAMVEAFPGDGLNENIALKMNFIFKDKHGELEHSSHVKNDTAN